LSLANSAGQTRQFTFATQSQLRDELTNSTGMYIVSIVPGTNKISRIEADHLCDQMRHLLNVLAKKNRIMIKHVCVQGCYKEHKEDSFLIMSGTKTDKYREEMESIAKLLAIKFEQESILYIQKGTAKLLMTPNQKDEQNQTMETQNQEDMFFNNFNFVDENQKPDNYTQFLLCDGTKCLVEFW
jgi:hypothetical protein